jgi:hypothetical protein
MSRVKGPVSVNETWESSSGWILIREESPYTEEEAHSFGLPPEEVDELLSHPGWSVVLEPYRTGIWLTCEPTFEAALEYVLRERIYGDGDRAEIDAILANPELRREGQLRAVTSRAQEETES